MPALAAISDSLQLYGHGPVELVYTDNVRSDKSELEHMIPSLRSDIVPILDLSSLPKLVIPQDWQILVLSSRYQVNTRLGSMMEGFDSSQDSYLAMDMEWAVDRANGIQGKVAVISIALPSEIFILPVSALSPSKIIAQCCLGQLTKYLVNGQLQLPHGLLSLLRAPSIRKVGVRIDADLARLYRDCGFSEGTDDRFVGGIDLARLAKERNATPKATTGLADLCSTLLRSFLPKDPAIRVSTAWDNDPLSDEQIQYAALDAFASWRVFEALNSMSKPQQIDASTPGGTAVSIISADRTHVVAHGHVALDRPKVHEGINVTKTRVLITVTSVEVPGHIISGDLLPSHQPTPLHEFPDPPFNLLCAAKHICTRIIPVTPQSPSTSNQPNTAPVQPHVPETSAPDVPDLHQESAPDTQWFADLDVTESGDQSTDTAVCDPAGVHQANQLVQSLSDSTGILRSRVLGDVWHLMDQFPISLHHGLRRPFARALRDAIFLYDTEDKAAVEDFLSHKGVSWHKMVQQHPGWILHRVKRHIPPPDILLPRVSEVLRTYGPLKDSKTGQPLFNDNAWEIAKNVLENIRRGFYSDPPGIPLYFTQGRDKYGLLRYKCHRGTNTIEGGVHQNIIRWFGKFNAAPDFAVELLRDYVLYHNLKVGGS